MKKFKNKAIFFDRDGVINYDYGYVHKICDFKWITGAKKIIKYLSKKNFLLIVITNQSGIAKGFYSIKDVRILHNYINEELSKISCKIHSFYFCPHHPRAKIKRFKKRCFCRKPGNLLIIKAIKKYKISIKDSYMIGDKKSDYLAAKKSNLKFIYINQKSFFNQIKNKIR
jgi:D-glycero-D-manno-heptose 1,7-bisphosphate phosphatase